jgi:PAS domain S-box-containing protein
MFSEVNAEAWKNDEMFRLLLSGVKDYAIVLFDDEGKVVRWNDGAETIQGFTADEIIGSNCARFYTEEDIKAGKPEVELRLARIAGRFHDEGWRLRKNGSRFWASFEITALRDKDGTLTGFGQVIRDITSRKDAEERLRKSEEMFRLLVLGVKDYAIVTLNTDGQVVSWNEGVQRIKGYSAEEVLGSHFSRFYTKEDIENGKPNMELAIAAREGRLEVEGWRVRKDQSLFRAHEVITALHDDAAKLVGFGKVTRDITSQREAEEALKAAKDQAELASRFKSEFLANMSHEIRTPMNGIIGITNILLRSSLADEQRQNLIILRDVGTSLLSVINDILDFSKVEAGKLTLESQAFEPLSLIEGIGDFFAAQARATNVNLITQIAPDLPNVIHGDAGRLRQVLMNLTSNAIKFSPNGEVLLKAYTSDYTANPIKIRFEVIDNGVGIAGEALGRIFNPFVQADGATNRKYGGTGLGLSISKRLVELMGGEIGVDSKLGQGATFWFAVPFENTTAGHNMSFARAKFDDLRLQS